MASQPTFDLQVPGRPDSSVMDWFPARGFDTWCLDNEGYGRSDKQRPINCDISSGALKAAVFAERHPERVARLALDDSVPTGTYVDMCSKLPLVDPARLSVPTILMRGQYDGIAGMDDLIEFFKRLPNPDKQFVVMLGISHASFQQKNYMTVYHILHSFFTQPEPVYRG